MNNYIKRIGLLSVVVVLISLANDGQAKQPVEREKLMNLMIRLSSNNYLRPEATLGCLRLLNGTQFDHFSSNELIGFSNPDLNKCNISHFRRMDTMALKYKNLPRTILAYILDSRRRQIDLCQVSFLELLEKSVNEFTDYEMNDVKLLMGNLNSLQSGSKLWLMNFSSRELTKEKIEEVALQFLISKQRILEAMDQKFTHMSDLYDNIEMQLTNRCKSIKQKLDSLFYVYKTSKRNPGAPIISKWMNVAKFCDSILSQYHLLSEVEAIWAKTYNGQRSKIANT